MNGRIPGMSGPDIALKTLETGRVHGVFGEASDNINEAFLDLVTPERRAEAFPLGGETRKDKFVGTLCSFTEGGVALGATLGTGLMFVPDLIWGRGHVRQDGEVSPFIDKGALGYVATGATVGVSIASEFSGMATGGLVSIADAPAQPVTKGAFGEWVADHATSAGKIFATHVSVPVGIAFSAVLGALRSVSLGVKYALAGVFGALSAIVGFFAATFRAIFNV